MSLMLMYYVHQGMIYDCWILFICLCVSKITIEITAQCTMYLHQVLRVGGSWFKIIELF